MFVYALLVICLEVYSLWIESTGQDIASRSSDLSSSIDAGLSFSTASFVFVTIGLFLFYAVLHRIFEIFAPSKGAAIFSILPAILLFFLLRRVEDMPYLGAAVIISALLRLFFDFIPVADRIIEFGALILAVVAVYLY